MEKKCYQLLLGVWMSLLLVIPFMASPALAAFPEKPIQIICCYAAGGGTDMTLRIISSAAAPHFGQPVVVVNKAGGGGSVGLQFAAKAKPDGYTIVSGSLAILLLHPLLDKSLPHSHRDFIPIGQFNLFEIAFVVREDSPWKNFKDFIKYAKEHPNEIKYGSAGTGTTGHFLMEYVCNAEGGIKMTHIPFEGTGPAMTALLGGHIHTTCADVPPALPLIQAKKMRALAVTNNERIKALPDVPSFPELGYRGLDVWGGLFVPKGTPPEVVKHLEQALEATLKDKACVALFNQIGQEPRFMGGEKLKAKADEDEKWLAEVITKLGFGKK